MAWPGQGSQWTTEVISAMGTLDCELVDLSVARLVEVAHAAIRNPRHLILFSVLEHHGLYASTKFIPSIRCRGCGASAHACPQTTKDRAIEKAAHTPCSNMKHFIEHQNDNHNLPGRRLAGHNRPLRHPLARDNPHSVRQFHCRLPIHRRSRRREHPVYQHRIPDAESVL